MLKITYLEQCKEFDVTPYHMLQCMQGLGPSLSYAPLGL